MLIKLLKKLYPHLEVPKYSENAPMRVHKLDNVCNALRMLEQAGVSVAFLKPIGNLFFFV
jgi:hypothetical protein